MRPVLALQKLASQTASSYKVLPGHCSTPVSKQLLSRLATQIARDKTGKVSPTGSESPALLLQRRSAKRPHPLPRILQGFTRRWLREGARWAKVTKPAGQSRDSNPGPRGSCQSRAEWGTDLRRPPVDPRPTPDPGVPRTPHSTRAWAPHLAPAIAAAAAAAASAGEVASSPLAAPPASRPSRGAAPPPARPLLHLLARTN